MNTQNIADQLNSALALYHARFLRTLMVHWCLRCRCKDGCPDCRDWRYLDVDTFRRYQDVLGITQQEVLLAVDELCRAQLAEVDPLGLEVVLTKKGKQLMSLGFG